MAKLYVVIGSFDYEGYGTPVGIFDNLDVAKSVATAERGWNGVEVLEYELNTSNDPETVFSLENGWNGAQTITMDDYDRLVTKVTKP